LASPNSVLAQSSVSFSSTNLECRRKLDEPKLLTSA
jgi:hypothetical protein